MIAVTAVSLSVPAATAGSIHDAAVNDVLQEVAGYITLQPTVAVGEPWHHSSLASYLVPARASNVSARATRGGQSQKSASRIATG